MPTLTSSGRKRSRVKKNSVLYFKYKYEHSSCRPNATCTSLFLTLLLFLFKFNLLKLVNTHVIYSDIWQAKVKVSQKLNEQRHCDVLLKTILNQILNLGINSL